jgi:hypothetical protein
MSIRNHQVSPPRGNCSLPYQLRCHQMQKDCLFIDQQKSLSAYVLVFQTYIHYEMMAKLQYTYLLKLKIVAVQRINVNNRILKCHIKIWHVQTARYRIKLTIQFLLHPSNTFSVCLVITSYENCLLPHSVSSCTILS